MFKVSGPPQTGVLKCAGKDKNQAASNSSQLGEQQSIIEHVRLSNQEKTNHSLQQPTH